MAEAIYLQDGEKIDYTPAVAVAAGEVITLQDLIGVASEPIAANALGALQIDGVFDVTKATGAIVAGDNIYWDEANSNATRTPAGNKYLGKAVIAAASGDARVKVRIGRNVGADLIKAAVAAGTALTASSTKTILDSVGIPANALKAGDVIRVRAQVIATATNSTDTLAVTLDFGGAVIATTGAVDVANNDIGWVDFDIVVRTAGASGTMVAAGVVALGVPGTVTAKPKSMASTALDTTVANTVAINGTWSTTDVGNSCRLDVLNVQILRK
jgi:predicted RecA/RadA family phage recombinase